MEICQETGELYMVYRILIITIVKKEEEEVYDQLKEISHKKWKNYLWYTHGNNHDPTPSTTKQQNNSAAAKEELRRVKIY